MTVNEQEEKKQRELHQLSVQFEIPQKVIEKLILDGLIHYPPTDTDLDRLAFLKDFWSKIHYIKLQLARHDTKTRLRIIQTADLNKYETYIFSRYKNYYLQKQNGKKTVQLSVKKIAAEVSQYYKIESTEWLYATIQKLKKRAKESAKKMTKSPLS